MLKAFACSEIRFDGPRAVTNARADSVHNTIESAVPLFSAERIASCTRKTGLCSTKNKH